VGWQWYVSGVLVRLTFVVELLNIELQIIHILFIGSLNMTVIDNSSERAHANQRGEAEQGKQA